ncbi:hypothetical protein ACPEIC_47600, partial [Stenotrophomonas sp. NPDC087984]
MNEELNTLLVALYVLINDHVALSRACRGRQLLLSATPVPCGMSRETVNRSELAGLPGKAADFLRAAERARKRPRALAGRRLHALLGLVAGERSTRPGEARVVHLCTGHATPMTSGVQVKGITPTVLAAVRSMGHTAPSFARPSDARGADGCVRRDL